MDIHGVYGNATSLPFCPTNVGENRGDWTTSSLRRIPRKKCGWDDGIIIPFLQLNIKTILKTNNMLETMNLIYLYFPILYPQSITLLKSQRITVNHHFHWLDHVKSQFLQNSTSCCPGSKKNITIVPFVLLRFAHFD